MKQIERCLFFAVFVFMGVFTSCSTDDDSFDPQEEYSQAEKLKTDSIDFVIDGPKAFMTADGIFYAERGSVATLVGCTNGVTIKSWNWIFYDSNPPEQKGPNDFSWHSKEFKIDCPSKSLIAVIGFDQNGKKFEKTKEVIVVDSEKIKFYEGIIMLSSEKKGNFVSVVFACNKAGMAYKGCDNYVYRMSNKLAAVDSQDKNYNLSIKENKIFAEAVKNGSGKYFLLRMTFSDSAAYSSYDFKIGQLVKNKFYPGKFWGDFVDTYHRDSVGVYVIRDGRVYPKNTGSYHLNLSSNPYDDSCPSPIW